MTSASLSEILNSDPVAVANPDSMKTTPMSSGNQASTHEKTDSVATTSADPSPAIREPESSDNSTSAPKEKPTTNSSDSSTSKVGPSKEEGASKTEGKPAIETKPLVVTNSQNVREVETTKCSTGYQVTLSLFLRASIQY